MKNSLLKLGGIIFVVGGLLLTSALITFAASEGGDDSSPAPSCHLIQTQRGKRAIWTRLPSATGHYFSLTKDILIRKGDALSISCVLSANDYLTATKTEQYNLAP